MYTFLGVDAEDPVGVHPLKIDFTQANGTKGTLNKQLTVLATEWTVESLNFDPEKSDIIDDPRVQTNEVELLQQVYSQQTPEKLWDGGWQMPVDGPITAHMGEQRSTNGGPVEGHHSGTDIGVDAGTPIHATNNGKVVLARQMTVRGNMVILDHGGGLFSGYAHMSSFAVAEGQVVHKGDVIGYVGNTGLSTGAHLHWEIAEGGIFLDALRFTDGTNGF
jgi:murein DD-endopeptidase MepM/ murein hydrolase activator NlpD